MKHPEGIEGLEGRDPVAGTVTVGIKASGGGYPIEKDKFHIVSARAVDDVKPPLPQFADYHRQPTEKRRMLRGVLTHKNRAECFEHRLVMQTFPQGYPGPRSHENMLPVCEGDGHRASRWMQGAEGEEFKPINCPHDQCEFRQMKKPACKPFMRFLFSLRWPDGNPLPTPMVKFVSRAWSTTSNFIGFFDDIDKAIKWCVEDQGMWPAPTYYGLPFTLTLTEVSRKKDGENQRFPVVIISPDVTPASFLIAQRQQTVQLKGNRPMIAITDASLRDDATVYEDIKTVEVPSR